jgi:hypothetical protein
VVVDRTMAWDGSAFGEAPLTKAYHLDPHSRRTIYVDEEKFPDDSGTARLAGGDAAAVVQVTGGGPILVERAMYASAPGEPFAAGHASAGINTPAVKWFMAEGATGSFFELFMLVANPNPGTATVTARYLLTDGTVQSKIYTMPGDGRLTIWVDEEELPSGRASSRSRTWRSRPRSTRTCPWWWSAPCGGRAVRPGVKATPRRRRPSPAPAG